MSTVNVDAKLSLNKFYVNEEDAHIVLKQNAATESDEFRKLMLACPAGLYQQDDKGRIQFDYAGCLECGTCRILCGNTILEEWEFPQGTFGIEYRWG